MRVLALLACAIGCGHARPADDELPSERARLDDELAAPPDEGSTVAGPAPDGVGTVWRLSPAELERKLAMLRELATRSSGRDELEVQARIFHLLDESGEPARRAEALALGERIVARPEFSQIALADQVLYALADALVHARRRDDARRVWTRLVQEFPRSRLVTAAMVGLADLAFEDADLIVARDLYQRAMGDAKLGPYARYKHGWTMWNLGDAAAAMADFFELARQAPAPLREAARHDLVRAYADGGVAAKAAHFFARIDRTAAPLLLAELGDRYRDIGKFADALVVYGAAGPALPPARACGVLAGTAEVHWGLGDRAAAAATLRSIVGLGPDPVCAADAADTATRLAEATELEARRRAVSREGAIAAWVIARTLAAPGPARLAAAVATARVAAEHASAVGSGVAWADAAEAYAEAAIAGAADASAAAQDAWRQAVARDPSLRVRAVAGLEALSQAP